MDEIRTPGKTTIAPNVLIDIAEMTTLNVDGISKMGKTPINRNILKTLNHRNGIQVSITENLVSYEIHIEVFPGFDIQKIAKNIQSDISTMMEKMVGMDIEEINIHVDNIDYETKIPS
jgi:uncharacterized alkaline shock family protein YloU